MDWSFLSVTSIVAILSLTYMLGSVFYVHTLFYQFDIDTSGLVDLADYASLSVNGAMLSTLLTFVAGYIALCFRYMEAADAVFRTEIGDRVQKNTSFGYLMYFHVALFNMPVIGSPLWGHTDYLSFALWFDAFLVISFLIGKLPIDRIFDRGYPIKLLITTIWVFVGSMAYCARYDAGSLKTGPDRGWIYTVENAQLISSDYSIVAETSKALVLYHRNNKVIEVYPVERISNRVIWEKADQSTDDQANKEE